MSKITTVGLDTAKHVFHSVSMTAQGRVVKKKQLKRKEVLSFLARLEPCKVVLEACSGSHYWAREIIKLGHDCRLIAPQYVKPFVKGNKNDFNDAEAIAEASQRAQMRFVPIKSAAQQDMKTYIANEKD